MDNPIFSDSDATPVTPTRSLHTVLSIPLDKQNLCYKITDSTLQHALHHCRSKISAEQIQQAISQCNTILLLRWKQKQNPIFFQLCRTLLIIFALLCLCICIACFILLFFFRSLWIQIVILVFPFPLLVFLLPLGAIIYFFQRLQMQNGKEASIESMDSYLKKENEQCFSKHRIYLQLNKENMCLELQQEHTRVLDELFPEII